MNEFLTGWYIAAVALVFALGFPVVVFSTPPGPVYVFVVSLGCIALGMWITRP